MVKSLKFLSTEPVPRPRVFCFIRMGRLPDGWSINIRCHSTNVFLNHAQMNPQSLYVDIEWAWNLEQVHGGVNFGDSCPILAQSGPVCALGEVALQLS